MEVGRILQLCREIDPYEFEKLVAEIWRNYGYDCEVTSGSGDKGIDIIATRSAPVSEVNIIQAKRYSSDNKIGSKEVREYATLRQQEDADKVILVTTSEFTDPARDLAESLEVDIINGRELADQIVDLDLIDQLPSTDHHVDETDSDESADQSTQDSVDSSPDRADELLSVLDSTTAEQADMVIESLSAAEKEFLLNELPGKIPTKIGVDGHARLALSVALKHGSADQIWQGSGGDVQNTRAVHGVKAPRSGVTYPRSGWTRGSWLSNTRRVVPVAFGDFVVTSTPDDTIELRHRGSAIWETDPYGQIESSPALGETKLFVPTYDRNGGDIHILDVRSGEKIDRIKTDSRPISVITAGGAVYVSTLDGTVFMYDTNIASRIWTNETLRHSVSEVGSTNYNVKYLPEMALDSPDGISGRLFVPTIEGALSALDMETGEIQWKYTVEAEVWSNPAVTNNSILLPDSTGQITKLDIASGDEKWSRRPDVEIPDYASFPPDPTAHESQKGFPPTLAVQDGILCVNWYRYVIGMDTTSGSQIWEFEPRNGKPNSPLICDDMVYFTDLRRLYGIELSEGRGMFDYDLNKSKHRLAGDPMPGGDIGWAGDTIIVSTWNNIIALGGK